MTSPRKIFILKSSEQRALFRFHRLGSQLSSRMSGLIAAGPVWAVDSADNREFTQRLWTDSPTPGHLDGVTLFKASENRSPEQMLINWMDTIDLHHGVCSADPPYTAIRVVGSILTSEGRQILGTFGFASFKVTDEVFDAARPLPGALEVDEPAGRN